MLNKVVSSAIHRLSFHQTSSSYTWRVPSTASTSSGTRVQEMKEETHNSIIQCINSNNFCIYRVMIQPLWYSMAPSLAHQYDPAFHRPEAMSEESMAPHNAFHPCNVFGGCPPTLWLLLYTSMIIASMMVPLKTTLLNMTAPSCGWSPNMLQCIHNHPFCAHSLI